MNGPLKGKGEGEDKARMLRHDIRNQLSNIQLALAQLRYELPASADEGVFYIDMITSSCKTIEDLIKEG